MELLRCTSVPNGVVLEQHNERFLGNCHLSDLAFESFVFVEFAQRCVRRLGVIALDTSCLKQFSLMAYSNGEGVISV